MLLCLYISFDHTLGLPLPFCLHCDSILRSTVIVVVVVVDVDVDLHSQLPSRAFMLIMRSLQLVGWLVGNPKIAPFVKLAKKSSVRPCCKKIRQCNKKWCQKPFRLCGAVHFSIEPAPFRFLLDSLL